MDRKHPQTAYAGLQKSFQQDWAFVQRVTPNIGNTFGPVVEALQDYFLLSLFQGAGEGVPGQGVTFLTVKQAGLDLPDPTNTAPENWTASCVITGNLIAALRGQEELRTTDYTAFIREGQGEVQNRNIIRSKAALAETIVGAPVKVARHLRRVTKVGAWMMLQPSTVNGTELCGQE